MLQIKLNSIMMNVLVNKNLLHVILYVEVLTETMTER